jgi:hypothetical protein
MVKKLEALFPGLRAGNYRITSPSRRGYNCIAWAVVYQFARLVP